MFKLSHFKYYSSALVAIIFISWAMDKPTRLWPIANDIVYLSQQAGVKLGLIEADPELGFYESDSKKALNDLLAMYLAYEEVKWPNQRNIDDIITLIKYHPELMQQEIRKKILLLNILSINSWTPPLSPNLFEPLAQQLFNSSINFNVDINDRDGDTPLMNAVSLGNISMVKHLLDRGADVNFQNHNRKIHKNALRIAVLSENPVTAIQVIQILLENGADTDDLMKPLEGGQTTLQRANPQVQAFIQEYLKMRKIN